ncbi:MAG TPA: hypothetical protein PKC35_15725, partial [Leptospiraceae bacterium]|nr:hypothetical protein [Leptospiraceae bacterium]
MRALFAFLLFYSGFSLAAEPCVAPLKLSEEDPGAPLARRSRPLHPGDPCETADSNIQKSLAEILKSNGGPVIRPSGTGLVKGMDLVSRRFALSG